MHRNIKISAKLVSLSMHSELVVAAHDAVKHYSVSGRRHDNPYPNTTLAIIIGRRNVTTVTKSF